MSLFACGRVLSLWIALGCAFAAWPGGERALGETVVRVVIVHTSGLPGSDKDAQMVKELFEKGLANQAKLEFAPPVVIPATGAKKAPIVQAIRDLPSDADDVVVIYYSGHGGYSEARSQHVLTIGGEMLSRTELRVLLFQKKVQLGVILTDCCSDIIPGKPALPTIDEANLQRAMKMLFLDARGMVDITSASTGERAWGEGSGGLFTRAFFESAWSGNQKASNWTEFFEEVKKRTQLRFLGFKEAQGENELLDVEERAFLASQQSQTPEAFQLGGLNRRVGDPEPPRAAAAEPSVKATVPAQGAPPEGPPLPPKKVNPPQFRGPRPAILPQPAPRIPAPPDNGNF